MLNGLTLLIRQKVKLFPFFSGKMPFSGKKHYLDAFFKGEKSLYLGVSNFSLLLDYLMEAEFPFTKANASIKIEILFNF